MATTVNISIDQGSQFSYSYELGANAEVSLSGAVVVAAMKTEYDSANSVSFGTLIDGTNVVITMTDVVSANLTPGTWVYDVLVIDSSNAATRIVQGRARVGPAVTPRP